MQALTLSPSCKQKPSDLTTSELEWICSKERQPHAPTNSKPATLMQLTHPTNTNRAGTRTRATGTRIERKESASTVEDKAISHITARHPRSSTANKAMDSNSRIKEETRTTEATADTNPAKQEL